MLHGFQRGSLLCEAKGLKAAELNGTIGTATRYIPETGRYGVVLAGTKSPKAFKIDNIEPGAYIYI